MKFILFSILTISLIACSDRHPAIVNNNFVDSLIKSFDSAEAYKATDADLLFWKKRINTKSFDVTNGGKYAALLTKQFSERGQIKNLAEADSINLYNAQGLRNKYAPPYLSLIYSSITQHQFARADSFLQIANKIGLEPFKKLVAEFDINFELGRMSYAKDLLERMPEKKEFPYFFRKAKLLHYEADLPGAIQSLEAAISATNSQLELQNIAYSNLADMYLHNGNVEKSKENYLLALQQDKTNMHAVLGLGWLSLLHDADDNMAEQLFTFVDKQIISPEAIYKQIQLQQIRKNKDKEIELAKRYEALATKEGYNNMYNKYLIELYTGTLANPWKALLIAQNELLNRNTAQTNAWYAYALMSTGKADEAYDHYKKTVSGKPLEGLELYYMGKLMEAVKKGYNASQFYKEAKKNLYDLSPRIQEDLKTKD